MKNILHKHHTLSELNITPSDLALCCCIFLLPHLRNIEQISLPRCKPA